MKTFTGDVNKFNKIKNFLLDKGFQVVDATHIGDDKFEFEEEWNSSKLGCHNLHKILAWEDIGEIKYKTVVVGRYCID